MKTKSSNKTEAALIIVVVCGLLGFFSFGWYGLIIGAVTGALGGLYVMSD